MSPSRSSRSRSRGNVTPVVRRRTGATSRGGAERRVLEHAWPVLDHLDAAVEGAMVDHLEGDVGVAVVDALLSRGPGDDREHADPEPVDEQTLHASAVAARPVTWRCALDDLRGRAVAS